MEDILKHSTVIPIGIPKLSNGNIVNLERAISALQQLATANSNVIQHLTPCFLTAMLGKAHLAQNAAQVLYTSALDNIKRGVTVEDTSATPTFLLQPVEEALDAVLEACDKLNCVQSRFPKGDYLSKLFDKAVQLFICKQPVGPKEDCAAAANLMQELQSACRHFLGAINEKQNGTMPARCVVAMILRLCEYGPFLDNGMSSHQPTDVSSRSNMVRALYKAYGDALSAAALVKNYN